MKLWAKIVLGIVGTCALGGGGYLIAHYLRRRKEEKDMNEPIEVEFVPYRPEAKKDIVRDEDDRKHRETDVNKEKFAKCVASYVETPEEKENFELYLAGMESPEDDSDEEFDEDDDHPERGSDKPYDITAGEFCNTRTYYDKVSLNYFMKDDVVADDRDEIMENAEHILGNLQAFASWPDVPSVVYIRNEALEVDYEISMVDGSYRKDVLNLNEEGNNE